MPSAPPKSEQSPSLLTDAEIILLWDSGQTMAEIAAKFDVTRERIRQRLKRNHRGGPNANRLPTAAAIRIHAAAAVSRQDLAERLAVPTTRLGDALDKHAIGDEIGDMMRKNRQARTQDRQEGQRQAQLGAIFALAMSVRHTPTERELEKIGVFPARLATLFGSMPQAMTLCGLVPNEAGKAPMALPPGFGAELGATSDPAELEDRAGKVAKRGTPARPAGRTKPKKVTRTVTEYERDPAVVAWARHEAAGICESCDTPGYEKKDGTVHLDVHHVLPLSEGGPDVVENAVAICELCHGKLHRWKLRALMTAGLFKNVPRLVDYSDPANAIP